MFIRDKDFYFLCNFSLLSYGFFQFLMIDIIQKWFSTMIFRINFEILNFPTNSFLAFPTNLFIQSNSFINFQIFFYPTPLFHPTCLLGTTEYSLVPKLWWKSLFMKQSSKLNLALKDPKPATIHFSYFLQLKEDRGCPNNW